MLQSTDPEGIRPEETPCSVDCSSKFGISVGIGQLEVIEQTLDKRYGETNCGTHVLTYSNSNTKARSQTRTQARSVSVHSLTPTVAMLRNKIKKCM